MIIHGLLAPIFLPDLFSPFAPITFRQLYYAVDGLMTAIKMCKTAKLGLQFAILMFR